MDCREKNLGDATLVTASGRIDLSNADSFRDSLSRALSTTTRALVLDFSGVDYISSAGLRSLMIVFKAGKAQGKSLAIAALKPLVKEIFSISRFDLVFPLFASVRDAIKAQAPEALAALDAG